MERNVSLYWLCQICGWGIAAFYWAYYQIVGNDPIWIEVLSVVLPFSVMILATHIYKNLAHKYGWINYPISKLVWTMTIALISLVCVYLLVSRIGCIGRNVTIDVDSFLGMFTGGLRYVSIWLLAFHMYHYARSSRQAEIDQKNSEKLLIEAQYNQLNTELNPHFLFNALNSIKALTIEDQKKARSAIDHLSSLLRQSLSHRNTMVIPLSEELDRITAYLDLEKIRFEERLQYSLRVDNTLMLYTLPPLSLFNLVENAVKHGLLNKGGSDKIMICGSKENERLILRVENFGSLDLESEHGIGLENISKRLEIIYGKVASLNISELEGGQVRSELIIPIHE